MNKFIISFSSVLLLTACGGPTLVLDANFSTDKEELVVHLEEATENVIERMTFAIEQDVPKIAVKTRGDGIRITIGLNNQDTADALIAGLTTPLDVRFAIEADKGETPDITSEQYGDFVFSDFEGEYIQWVSVESNQNRTMKEDSEISTTISIMISPEGQEIWKSLQNNHNGKKMGLFVRGGLVSLTTIEKTEGTPDVFNIPNIPSLELAKVFADDINVGRYATFTTVK